MQGGLLYGRVLCPIWSRYLPDDALAAVMTAVTLPRKYANSTHPKIIITLANANSPGATGWNQGDFMTIESAQ